MAGPDQIAFETAGAGGTTLRGWTQGEEGPAIVLCHGITAHRDLVVHGSSHLPRAGYELISYDARAHGESEPAGGEGYGYEVLRADLESVCGDQLEEAARPILCGHSMGAHTVLAAALVEPDRYAGLIVIGPVSRGEPPPADSLAYWDRLAEGLRSGGVDGWLEAYEAGGFDPGWRETLLRIARDRMERHRHTDALADALQEVPRSVPYEGLDGLARLELPALVVASHDVADPGHPYETAELVAEALPEARLISEEEGESPLAWQGGKLSREIEEFAESRAARERLEG